MSITPGYLHATPAFPGEIYAEGQSRFSMGLARVYAHVDTGFRPLGVRQVSPGGTTCSSPWLVLGKTHDTF